MALSVLFANKRLKAITIPTVFYKTEPETLQTVVGNKSDCTIAGETVAQSALLLARDNVPPSQEGCGKSRKPTHTHTLTRPVQV